VVAIGLKIEQQVMMIFMGIVCEWKW